MVVPNDGVPIAIDHIDDWTPTAWVAYSHIACQNASASSSVAGGRLEALRYLLTLEVIISMNSDCDVRCDDDIFHSAQRTRFVVCDD